MSKRTYDAVIVGSGPNGLSAAIVLAQAGWKTLVIEAEAELGGGVRTAELTLPGLRHDLCSSVYPMAVATGFFQSLGLERLGLEWVHPPRLLAHPFADGTAATLESDLEATAAALGAAGPAYRRLLAPVVSSWQTFEADFLGPIHWPRHPLKAVPIARRALAPALRTARWLRDARAMALWAGLAAHSIQPLDRPGTSAIALTLAAAGHVAGWPFVRGGSQALTAALAACLANLGGETLNCCKISHVTDLPESKTVLLDVSPASLVHLYGDHLPAHYKKQLNSFLPGPGVFKLDWALSAPIPWTAPACHQAGTVHLGGSLEEITAYEATACEALPQKPLNSAASPFVLLTQPSLFDPTRTKNGFHTAWAYCHIPNGSTIDMTDAIENQVERFAPGFKTKVVARSSRGPAELEAHNANLRGGDIAGGANTLLQLVRRPSWRQYRTPLPGVYLCSASTPPGGGVHGLCGYWAARAALHDGRK